jgi:nucleotide-binding universal stress UspA family protein
LLGSVASGVIINAACPVMVVKWTLWLRIMHVN